MFQKRTKQNLFLYSISFIFFHIFHSENIKINKRESKIEIRIINKNKRFQLSYYYYLLLRL